MIDADSTNRSFTVVVNASAQVILSFGIATLLLAIIYKMIPEARVHWRDVTVAAIVTGIAFTVTNHLFGTYIQTFTVTTLLGTGGALLIILLWIFVLNQIVIFDAELSKVYSSNVGEHARQHLPATFEKIVEPIEKARKELNRQQRMNSRLERNPKKKSS